MAVRTGGPGPSVCQQGYPRVTMRGLEVSGHAYSGTTSIELDDVQIPVDNLIGKAGHGMKYITPNFNHERLTISVGVARQARVALSAAFDYCFKQEAFGKTLMDRLVVRHRLAKAGAELETLRAWFEQFLYQVNMSEEEGNRR